MHREIALENTYYTQWMIWKLIEVVHADCANNQTQNFLMNKIILKIKFVKFLSEYSILRTSDKSF